MWPGFIREIRDYVVAMLAGDGSVNVTLVGGATGGSTVKQGDPADDATAPWYTALYTAAGDALAVAIGATAPTSALYVGGVDGSGKLRGIALGASNQLLGLATALGRAAAAASMPVALSTEDAATLASLATKLDTLIAAFAPAPVIWNKVAADANASDATTETHFFVSPNARTVTSATLTPDSNLVGDDTDNATISVLSYDAADVPIGTVADTTTLTNWTAGVPLSLDLEDGGSLTAGAKVSVEIVKNGAGVIVPRFSLQIDFA